MKIENKDMWECVHYGALDWEVVEEGDWTQDYKYQYQTNIVKHKPTGKFYKYSVHRSGSPFTEWNYSYDYCNYPDLIEVVQKERVITQAYWEEVANETNN